MGCPMLAMFFALSFVNQMFRRCTGSCCGKKMSEEEKKYLLTEVAHKMYADMRNNWNWTSVIAKMYFWGFFYLGVQVGVTKVVYIFLSWLNEQLAAAPFPVVAAVFYCIGFFMFLTPAIPGVPVYITGGII